MSLVQLSTQGWSPLVDSSGNARPAVAFSLQKLSGTDVTLYSDVARTTTLLSADKVTNASGEYPGYAAPGEYTLTVGGKSWTVHVTAALGGKIGLSPSGVSATDTAALATAAALLNPVIGGTIELGDGDLAISAWPSFASSTSVTLKGQGGRSNGGEPTSRIVYSGTAAVDCRSSHGFRVCDLAVMYSNPSLSGKLFDLSHATSSDATYSAFERCTISGQSGATGCTALISLANAHGHQIRDCLFGYATCAVRGRDATNDYSNRVLIQACEFGNCSQAPIQDAGDAWSVDSCTFEPLSSGAAGGITNVVGISHTLRVTGCWFGDANATGTWVSFTGDSFHMEGCTVTTGQKGVVLTASSQAATVVGNHFEGGPSGAMSVGIDVKANVTDFDIEGNYFKPDGGTIVTTPVQVADANPVGGKWPGLTTTHTHRFGSPLTLPTYTTGTKPAAGNVPGGTIIYVSDGGAGAVIQASNGSSWVNLG